MGKGAAYRPELAGAEAPEPPSRLGPTDDIPNAVDAIQNALKKGLGFKLGHWECERILEALHDAGHFIMPIGSVLHAEAFVGEGMMPYQALVRVNASISPSAVGVSHLMDSAFLASESYIKAVSRHLANEALWHFEAELAPRIAKAMEARRDETQRGSACDSAVAEGNSP